ncbi:MAG TPA: methyl-accepting chemotaxis protein [Pantanalinema sp.]
MTIKQKLLFHVTSVAALIVGFQVLFGFRMSTATALFCLLLLAIDFAGDFWTLLSIRRDVHDVVDTMDAVSHGRLPTGIPITGAGEVADMQRALRRMVDSLRGIVSHVRASAQSVKDGVNRITASSEQTSESAHRQALAVTATTRTMREMADSVQKVASDTHALNGNVDETSRSIMDMAASIHQVADHADGLMAAVNQTSASVEEMAASIHHVAANAAEANRMAERATLAAQEGQEAVGQTVTGMTQIEGAMEEVLGLIDRLGDRSTQIGDIIEVIDDIADQTNLLALNAAIEAARAGDHGRGFAVVADEVRKLAERSSSAAGEIGQLIKGIQQETLQAIQATQRGNQATQAGSKLAHRAGDALATIVQSVEHASSSMAQIAGATQEQQKATDLIIAAVQHMSALTQQVMDGAHLEEQESRKITQAIDSMVRLTRHIAQSTAAQEQDGRRVTGEVANIDDAAQEAVNANRLINASAVQLDRQAQTLLEAISVFKDAALADGERRADLGTSSVVESVLDRTKQAATT